MNLHKLILFRRACHWLLTLCLSVGSLGLLWWLYFSLNFPEWHSWISITISEHKWLQTAEHARQSKKDSRLCQGQSVGSFTAQDKPGSHTPSQQAEKSHCCLRRYWKPRLCKGHVLFSQGLLQECNQLCAEYLFQPDKHYDVSYDTGDKSIQCGRHVDVFKLWLMWKAKVWQTSPYSN